MWACYFCRPRSRERWWRTVYVDSLNYLLLLTDGTKKYFVSLFLGFLHFALGKGANNYWVLALGTHALICYILKHCKIAFFFSWSALNQGACIVHRTQFLSNTLGLNSLFLWQSFWVLIQLIGYCAWGCCLVLHC